MGTILKYLFYIALIMLIYILAKDIYDGKINGRTDMNELTSQIETSSRELIREGAQAVKEEMDDSKAKK